MLGSYKLGWWEQPDALFTFLLLMTNATPTGNQVQARLFATFDIMSVTSAKPANVVFSSHRAIPGNEQGTKSVRQNHMYHSRMHPLLQHDAAHALLRSAQQTIVTISRLKLHFCNMRTRAAGPSSINHARVPPRSLMPHHHYKLRFFAGCVRHVPYLRARVWSYSVLAVHGIACGHSSVDGPLPVPHDYFWHARLGSSGTNPPALTVHLSLLAAPLLGRAGSSRTCKLPFSIACLCFYVCAQSCRLA